MFTGNAGPILPDTRALELIIKPLIRESIAGQVLTPVTIGTQKWRAPVVATDPSAAWTNEGEEIAVSDATLDEITATPKKLAALSVVSSELANDSSPAAIEAIGAGIVRDLVRKVDQALFSNAGTKAPKGLTSLTGTTDVLLAGGATWSNVDPFSSAQIQVAGKTNATITAWVANSATVSKLANLKRGTGSNEPLLGTDPTQPGRRVILGIPVIISDYLADDLVYGVSNATSYLIVREDATVEQDTSVFFTSDRVAIRAKSRLDFAFADPRTIAKIQVTP